MNVKRIPGYYRPAVGAILLVAVLAFSACGESKQANSASQTASGSLKKLVVSEPVHSLGYLPLYAAQAEGFFAAEGLDVQVLTASGGAHVTTVISGDAWASIGGPESNALADANGNNPEPLIAFSNCVNRANIYMLALPGMKPASNEDADLARFFKGHKIFGSRYGGTPNLLVRYLLLKVGLDPSKDVTLLEPSDSSVVLSFVKQGQVEIANSTEPIVTQGVIEGSWDEPFFKFPDLGDCAYSVFSTRKSTIAKDPQTVQAFTNAIVKVLKVMAEDKEFSFRIAKQEFSNLSDEILKGSLDRAYADNLWSPDGVITPAGLDLDMDVMIKTGIFKGTYTYDGMVDMSFVKKANSI
jgi:NitT/TauT family transport system substrate-binding protein